MKYTLLERIFSVKNADNKKHKIITFWGLKLKIRSKKYTGNQDKNNYTPILHDKVGLDFLLTHVFWDKIPQFSSNNITSVSVLIPVYNGVKHLKNLLPSLIKNTPNFVKIIIIDDCSPDNEVQKYLNNYINSDNITLIRNESNLGFVKTINKGMKLINTKYAVWLNSDTIVPEYWLERLLYPFDNCNKIATTTPFTNSGCTYSFPIFCEDNKVNKSINEIDKYFQRINTFDTFLNETYSGTGFCMAIDMDCWQDVGPLDEGNFGKGYGEENDWCFRASKKGYKHYLVPNLFVQHCHGGSFLAKEKKTLVEQHLKILKSKYPKEMNEIVSDFIQNDPWSVYRNIISILFCSNNPLLILDLKLDKYSYSGAYVYRQNLVDELKSQGYDVILAQYEQNKKDEWSIIPESCSSDIEIKLKSFSEIKVLFEFLQIKKVIVNNLAYLANVEDAINIIYQLKKTYSFSVAYKFHDYLSICPSFFLIDNSGTNCQNPCVQICTNCLLTNPYKL